jgi:hypothetical protein
MPNNAQEVAIPRYEELPRRVLEELVRDLRATFSACLERIIGKPLTNAVEARAAVFFAESYDDLMLAKRPFSLCSVQDFVSRVGPLPEATALDAPPYTELLIQGFRGLAFRHPEYMLARDLEFDHDIFWQTEDLVRSHIAVRTPPNWMERAVENVQSLARATILSCFSLLESTVSGLARAHAMRHPKLGARERKRLLNSHGPLLERLLTVPEVITGRPTNLRLEEPPLSELFGVIKQRRDAFVHCEPGQEESRSGFVKQERFHEVTAENVDDAVRLTVEVVRTLWRHVHAAQSGPVWLGALGDRASYRRGLKIVTNE